MGRIKDCVQLAKDADINHYYCMTISDANKLRDAYESDLAKLMYECFKYGYVQGAKAQRAADKKKRTTTKAI